MNKKEKLEQLKQEESDLRAKLDSNRKEQRELIIEMFCQETGFNLGDEVVISGDRRGVIDSFRNIYGLSVHPIVKLYKKDGTIGKATKEVWGHEKIEKV